MKQAIIHSGIAEEYVNWSHVTFGCMRNVLEGHLVIDARHITLNLPILRLKNGSKPDQYLERSQYAALSYVRAYGVKMQRIIAIFGVDNLLHLMASPCASLCYHCCCYSATDVSRSP